MKSNDPNTTTDRRSFIGTIATGAAAMSLATLASPLQSVAAGTGRLHHAPNDDDPDAWFNKLKGKHKIVFDCT
ncbi:MAG TPA: twin-arginine translocation signal domain-containing protein, partial [Flavisolibacter sp.]|nr:twin-arginine translocation signal domain-containing protein [Flavisolibacter sp.]